MPYRLGRQIHAVRKRRRLTQTNVAMGAGITQQYVAELESGIRQNPSLTVIHKIAKALGVSMLALLR